MGKAQLSTTFTIMQSLTFTISRCPRKLKHQSFCHIQTIGRTAGLTLIITYSHFSRESMKCVMQC